MNKRQKQRLIKQIIVLINAVLGFSVGACLGGIVLLFLLVGLDIRPADELLFNLECFGIPGIPGLITMFIEIKDDLYVFQKEW